MIDIARCIYGRGSRSKQAICCISHVSAQHHSRQRVARASECNDDKYSVVSTRVSVVLGMGTRQETESNATASIGEQDEAARGGYSCPNLHVPMDSRVRQRGVMPQQAHARKVW
jgi:hypothetical protein